MARLDNDEIEAKLAELDGLGARGRRDHQGASSNGDFKGSVEFVNELTPVAEEMNHHPDLEISWDTVTVHDHDALRGRPDRERLRAGGHGSTAAGP